MSKKLLLFLILAFVVILGIVYASYEIYKFYQPESLCKSECSKEGCDNHTTFDCVQDINKCYYKQYKDKEIDVCGTECLTSDDCNGTLKCVSNECVEPRCGDEKCDKNNGENCNTCPEDCSMDSGEICCFSKIIEGECCSNSNCDESNYEICEDYRCIVGPYCGDGTCDEDLGENCETCKKDCRPSESEICCSGIIKTGDCCRDSQCEEGFDCKKNKCTLIS
ncbi:MAG: hypothetical protein KJ623_00650 [Nanoarchaeota archaeon]|nr:hypothetical protein [Nanoarchaeota archaeon]MBU0963089.1 hypothetical protein [Nanoarchaeota archaeon]